MQKIYTIRSYSQSGVGHTHTGTVAQLAERFERYLTLGSERNPRINKRPKTFKSLFDNLRLTAEVLKKPGDSKPAMFETDY